MLLYIRLLSFHSSIHPFSSPFLCSFSHSSLGLSSGHMDCIAIDDDDKANNNVSTVVMEQVNNDIPTTSGTTTANVVEKQAQEEGKECLENINISDKIEEQDETKIPSDSSPIMMIVKGKRTKRERINSPIFGENLCTNNQEDENVEVMIDEDEEMDMANCLILLAKGPSRPPLRNELGLFTSGRGSAMRFTSENKRLSFNNSSVYECKTCNRTFPSFQALGGHRASHKKLKMITTNAITTGDYDHSFSQMVTLASSSTSPLSLQLGNINYTSSTRAPPTNFVTQNNIRNKNRVHECAICGAEFSSGQALGGHMRRHRGGGGGGGSIMPLNSSTTTATAATTLNNKHTFANTTLSLSTVADNAVATTAVESKVNRMNDGFLSLDLNLPASPSQCPIASIPHPTEHDVNESTKLSKQQPQTSSGVVLSTPALVDCFY